MASAVSRDESTVCDGNSLSGNLVPLIYALNAQMTRPDILIIGADSQVFADLCSRLLRSFGYPAIAHLLIPTIPGCNGQKMSCSIPDFLLDPLDTPKQLKTKIARSFCEPQNLDGNVAMQLAEHIVFPILNGAALHIQRAPDNGGDVEVTNYKQLEQEFVIGTKNEQQFPLHPADLKNAVVGVINR